MPAWHTCWPSTRALLTARAALYDERGNRLSIKAFPFSANYPRPGWVEQDAEDIWQAQIEAARAVAGGARETHCRAWDHESA